MKESREYDFSIITVCYNAESSIEETIKSVISQNYENFEFIIIDGKSSDNTMQIVNKYKSHIDQVVSDTDLGIYDAMNKGLAIAKGKFVNFMNSGDKFLDSTILTKVANEIDWEETRIISGDLILVNNQDALNRVILTRPLEIKYLKRDFYACHQAIFINFKDVSKYDLRYKIKADYKWVASAVLDMNKNEIIKLEYPIVNYSQEGLSYNSFWKGLNELIRIQNELFGIKRVLLNIDIYLFKISKYLIRKIRH